MALTGTNIIGRIALPDDTNPVNSVVRFIMTGFDTDDIENATVVPIPIDAAIDALGDIDVDLWPNPLGVRTTFYSTYARIPDGNTNDVISIYLGKISVPATGGPYDLNDLLPIAPPAGADVADYIAQLAAAVAATEADAAQTALDRVATGVDVVAAGVQKAAAQAAASDASDTLDAVVLAAQAKKGFRETTIAAAIADALTDPDLAVGDTFAAAANDVDFIGLYVIETGPVSAEIGRFPTYLPVAVNSAWVDLPSTTTVSVGSLAPTGTPYSSTRFVGPAVGTPTDGIVRSLTVEVTSTLTAQIALMKPRRQNSASNGTMEFEVIATKSVSALAVGTQTIDFGSIAAPAGTRVLMRRSVGAIDGDATTAGSCEHNSLTATVGEVKALSLGINRALAMQLNYIPLPLGTLARAALKSAAANKAGGDQREDIGDQAASVAASSSLSQRLEIGADIGLDVPSGAAIVGVKAALQTSAAANKAESFVMAVYRRLTDDVNVDASTSTGTPEYLTSRLYRGSDLGLVADGSEKTVLFDTDLIEVEDGYTYYASLSGLTAGGVLGAIGYGLDFARSTIRQRRRGWSVSGTSVTNVTTGGPDFAPVSLRMGFVYQEPVSLTIEGNTPAPIHIDKITDATISADGFDVSTQLAYSRDNTYFKTDDARTLTASATGNVRFDLLYLDRSTLLDFTEAPTFGVVAGTERANDPAEFIPTLNAGLGRAQTPVAYLRVSDSDVQVLPCWDVVNGEIEHLVPQIRLDRERNQRILRRALGRIRRGTPIKIAGIGDSIMALGNVGVTPGRLAPNGLARDIGSTQYYNVNIGSDLVDALPLFTSVQLGHVDDGGGAIHTKTGFVWTFVSAIQELSGLALGAAGVLYNNWGINSQKWSNLYSGGAATSWLQNFCAAGADLVVINMGMNDYTAPAFGADALGAIEYIKANMVDRDGNVPPIIIMGIARPNDSISQSQWSGSNRVLRSVAEKTGSAYVDLMPWYDEPNLRAVGMTGADTCTANGTNHPGIFEQEQVMGRALVRQTL